MPFLVTLVNSTHDSVTLPDGTVIPKQGLKVEQYDKKLFAKIKSVVRVEEIKTPTPEEAIEVQAAGPIGYIYTGDKELSVSGINGPFKPGIARFDLTQDELQLAATTGGILERVNNHSL